MSEINHGMPVSQAAALPAHAEARPASRSLATQLTGVRGWLALAPVLVLAAFLNFYQLSREGYANTYYAAAVKSMSQSWHNFFFVSFDPGGFVAVDKPPLGLWIQAASARLLGFSGVSLLIPQGIAAILSVFVLYILISRRFGHG